MRQFCCSNGRFFCLQEQQLGNLSKMEILADTTKQHQKEMGELCRKLEEERCCSASMKDHLSILQQQLCDAQRSAQVNFQKLQMQLLLMLDKFWNYYMEELCHTFETLIWCGSMHGYNVFCIFWGA
jgi:hypothetical protein